MSMEMKLFSEEEIIETYKKYVIKDVQYYNKVDENYKKISDEERKKLLELDFPRVASLFDFKDWIEKYNLKKVNSLLSTCENDIELNYIDWDYNKVCSYNNKENDLHTLNLSKKDFDMIIFNQTLEHVYNPFISMKNLFDHLKSGGYLYTTVPIINIPHMRPFHFWGITPIGLCMLSKSVGFKICECGYWGGYNYLGYIFSRGEWPKHDIVFDHNNKIENDELCQTQTWILVQKP